MGDALDDHDVVIVTAHRGVTLLHSVIGLFDRWTRYADKVILMREFVFDTTSAACWLKVTKWRGLSVVRVDFLCWYAASYHGTLRDDGW